MRAVAPYWFYLAIFQKLRHSRAGGNDEGYELTNFILVVTILVKLQHFTSPQKIKYTLKQGALILA